MQSVGPKVVVVTGASAGVGRATARLFGARGDRVALIARGEKGLASAAREVEAAGGTALPIVADVSDYDALDAAADRVTKELGRIDVWVNNAFSTVFAPFLDMAPEEFRRVTDVTYHGYMHGTRIALSRMLPNMPGTIVQVGSALAYRGIPLQSAYCGAKHAIQGFTEAIRCELLHRRAPVRITMVQLPAVNTPQFDWALSRMRRRAQPVPPIFQPDVAARAIVHAADHPRRREYWVGYSTVLTLLANKFAPGLLDRYLARTAYQAQQTDVPEDEDRPDNLWTPVDDEQGADHGTRGRFDGKARPTSPQQALSRHHGLLATVGGGLLWRALRKDDD